MNILNYEQYLTKYLLFSWQVWDLKRYLYVFGTVGWGHRECMFCKLVNNLTIMFDSPYFEGTKKNHLEQHSPRATQQTTR